ncbi:MAG: hypothetical protein GY679_01650 [Mycoplasma sp.]|nr:hypothetical protein [Mycoplasma sp.]
MTLDEYHTKGFELWGEKIKNETITNEWVEAYFGIYLNKLEEYGEKLEEEHDEIKKQYGDIMFEIARMQGKVGPYVDIEIDKGTIKIGYYADGEFYALLKDAKTGEIFNLSDRDKELAKKHFDKLNAEGKVIKDHFR